MVFAHTQVKCHHMLPLLHYRAIDAPPQEPYFYYDSLTDRARCSITNLVIIRATRALRFKAEPGLIIYQTEYTQHIGWNIPIDITFSRYCSSLARRH
ncbi:replication protein [Salmonella enterica]|uniref:Replication protein n=2 Tax=Salmonella enterica TaxID=28901 RepID=A0A379QCN3_SALER|nr:replication protein [Salmonella enterica]